MRVSRKLAFGVATSAGIVGCGVLAALFPAFGPHLGTVVSGLIGSYLVFAGGNVSATFAHAKADALASSPETHDHTT